MTDVTINVKGESLDPSKAYIIEVKQSDINGATMHGLTNALQQLKIKHVLVATDTGEAVNVVEVPEEAR